MRWFGAVTVVLLSLPGGAWGQPYAFVTSAGDSLAVVDVDQHAVVASLPLSGVPSGSALSPDAGRLYVALSDADALASIDLATGSMTAIPVGAAPAGVAADASFVYVANVWGDSVSVVSPASGSVVQTVPAGDSPLDLALGGGKLYVANWGDSTVTVFDTLSGMSLVGTVPVGTFPAGLALDVAAARLYVASFLDDTVSVVDTNTLSVIATIRVALRPRGLALDPTAGRLYVAGFEDAVIQVVDTATNKVVMKRPSGGANPIHLALGPDGRLFVVHAELENGVVVLDAASLAPLTVLGTPPVPITLAGFATQFPRALRGPRPRASVPRHEPRLRRPHVPSDVVIADTEFLPADWVAFGDAKFNAVRVATGGSDGGAWRRTSYGTPGGAYHEYRAASYDPSLQGDLQSVSFAWDHRIGGGGTASDGVLVYQGGNRYVCIDLACDPSEAPGASWSSVTAGPAFAVHFADAAGGHPDFTASGGPLTFGYASVAAAGMFHGMDEFSVTLHAGAGPGVLYLLHSNVAVLDEGELEILIGRAGGAQGEVGVQVVIDTGGTGCEIQQFADGTGWPDGDSSPRTLLVRPVCHGGGINTLKVTLANPTGGATIDPRPMVVEVYAQFFQLGFLAPLFLLLSGLSPVWLFALAGPALALAARRRRSR